MTRSPQRIQRRRTKGWKMPPGTIYVGRPTKWGNPHDWRQLGRDRAVKAFTQDIVDMNPDILIGLLAEIRGHDLACWCPLTEECHADLWLLLANEP